MTPYIPIGETLGDIDEYIEMSVNGLETFRGLEFMKTNPRPPRSVFTRFEEHLACQQSGIVDAANFNRISTLSREMVNGVEYYLCSGGQQMTRFYVPTAGWTACKTMFKGQTFDAYVYTSESGESYLSVNIM